MDNAIIAAFIAAIVSIIGVIISHFTTRHSLRQDRERLERQIQHHLTEKLYDLRLKHYPKAFEITEKLTGDTIFRSEVTPEYFHSLRDELKSWYGTQAGPFLSPRALKAYYHLRDVLESLPKDGNRYTKDEILQIWEAKNRFRRFLRADIDLLFDEESEEDDL